MSLRESLHDTLPDFRPLTPWNPLDQLRLLWWLFANPARFVDYENWAGREATRKVAAWLVSTLIWLLLFIPALGICLGLTRPIETPYGIIPSLSPATAGIIVLVWLVTGLLATKKLFNLGLFGALVMVGVALGVTTGLRIGVIAGVPVSVVLVVVKGIVRVVEEEDSRDKVFNEAEGILLGVFLGVSHVMTVIGAEFVAELGAVVLAVLGVLIVGDVVARVLNRSLQSGQSSLASRLILLMLALAYAVLVWVYLLGG